MAAVEVEVAVVVVATSAVATSVALQHVVVVIAPLAGRAPDWLKTKNPHAAAVKREEGD